MSSAPRTQFFDYRTLVIQADDGIIDPFHDSYVFSKRTFRETDEDGVYGFDIIIPPASMVDFTKQKDSQTIPVIF